MFFDKDPSPDDPRKQTIEADEIHPAVDRRLRRFLSAGKQRASRRQDHVNVAFRSRRTASPVTRLWRASHWADSNEKPIADPHRNIPKLVAGEQQVVVPKILIVASRGSNIMF